MFSVKSAYRLAMRIEHDEGNIGTSSTPPDGRKVWKNLWSTNVPEKVKVFAWKVANNSIPTQANKYYRHLAQYETCELCGHAREDCFHACVRCPHAVALRQAMRMHWVLPAEEDLQYTGPQWLLALASRFPVEVIGNLLMLLWRVWSVRNSVLRAGKRLSIDSSVLFLTRYRDSLMQCQLNSFHAEDKGKRCALIGSSQLERVARLEKKWVPPDPGWMKINVDGAFLPDSGVAAIGVIIRDHGGGIKLSAWRLLRHCRDAVEAEVVACREGIILAARWPEVPMILETDCAVVVGKLRNPVQDRSLIWSTIQEATVGMEDLCRVEVLKISRAQNNTAHQLAHYAIRSSSSQVFFSSFPEFVVSLACKNTV
jgi:ribonuclease HI